MDRKKLQIWLASLTMIAAFFSWRSVDQAIRVEGTSIWLVPIIFFSIFLVLISLDMVLFAKKSHLYVLFFLALATGTFLAKNPLHIIVALVAAYSLLYASIRIRKELKMNIKINLWKSLSMGKTLMLVSISFVIASQYYLEIRDMDGAKLIPHIKTDGITNSITKKLLANVDPNFKSLENKDMSVDEFILQIQLDQESSQRASYSDEESGNIIDSEFDRQNVPMEIREDLKNQTKIKLADIDNKMTKERQAVILKEGRMQLSSLAGREVQGGEKMSDIVSELISRKIESLITPDVAGENKYSSVSAIIATILFFSVLSIGSLLTPVFMGLSMVIFRIFVRTGLVSIKRDMVEQEILN